MKKRSCLHVKLLLVHCVILFAFIGCASRKVKLTETGFLSSYSDLRKTGDSGRMRVYRNPKAGIAQQYSKIIIAPVQFQLDQTVNAGKLNDEDQEQLAGYFHEQLKERLNKNYTITDSPGSDVLIIRSAITNIVPNIGVLNINMISLFSGSGLGGASLEAELVDSMTGERILAFVDARKGRKFKKGFAKWGHTEEAMEFWADAIVVHLDNLMGKYQTEVITKQAPTQNF